jgi:hypothetical protein
MGHRLRCEPGRNLRGALKAGATPIPAALRRRIKIVCHRCHMWSPMAHVTGPGPECRNVRLRHCRMKRAVRHEFRSLPRPAGYRCRRVPADNAPRNLLTRENRYLACRQTFLKFPTLGPQRGQWPVPGLWGTEVPGRRLQAKAARYAGTCGPDRWGLGVLLRPHSPGTTRLSESESDGWNNQLLVQSAGSALLRND